MTNSTPLQRVIDQQAQLHATPQPSDMDQDEGCYTKSTLGSSSQVNDGEQRILGIRWSYITDCLLFDMKDLALHASKLDPTKRGIVFVASRVYDHIVFVSPVMSGLRYCSRSCVTPKLAGMNLSHSTCFPSGLAWSLVYSKMCYLPFEGVILRICPYQVQL